MSGGCQLPQAGIETPGTATVLLETGTTDRAQDFGYTGQVRIGDRVWVDMDADGEQDPAEPGLPGIRVDVRARGADGEEGTGDDLLVPVLTVADGRWRMDNLRRDVDRDARLGAGDPGVGGVRVLATWFGPDGTLGGPDDLTVETRTDATGHCGFSGMPAGRYQVRFAPDTVPATLEPASDLDGGDPLAATVDLAAGAARTDVDVRLVDRQMARPVRTWPPSSPWPSRCCSLAGR